MTAPIFLGWDTIHNGGYAVKPRSLAKSAPPPSRQGRTPRFQLGAERGDLLRQVVDLAGLHLQRGDRHARVAVQIHPVPFRLDADQRFMAVDEEPEVLAGIGVPVSVCGEREREQLIAIRLELARREVVDVLLVARARDRAAAKLLPGIGGAADEILVAVVPWIALRSGRRALLAGRFAGAGGKSVTPVPPRHADGIAARDIPEQRSGPGVSLEIS